MYHFANSAKAHKTRDTHGKHGGKGNQKMKLVLIEQTTSKQTVRHTNKHKTNIRSQLPDAATHLCGLTHSFVITNSKLTADLDV